MIAEPGITTITISRQLGSLGRKVAEAAAQALGYRLMWRELINLAAQRAGAPEAALAAIDDLGLLGIYPSPKACLAYRQAVEQVMRECCREGQVVIMGRAGQVILGGRPDVLHVRIIAPLPVRIERVAAAQNISTECAHAQIEASDESRRKYLKKFYQVRWDDPELYDLVINTRRIMQDEAAGLIMSAVRTVSIVAA